MIDFSESLESVCKWVCNIYTFSINFKREVHHTVPLCCTAHTDHIDILREIELAVLSTYTATALIVKCGKSFLSCLATVFAEPGLQLSSIAMSAPDFAASISSSIERHSSSILVEKPPISRVRLTAEVMDHIDHIWLSFNITILNRSYLVKNTIKYLRMYQGVR